ncbi:MAG: hypothetical protein AUK37_07225 [Rhodobacterales bacterium CG2_30_65_12]|nr:MAG: hypothetical protein AUK37_07225 [Rhodobacterales bacterium CG2_30_65_12]
MFRTLQFLALTLAVAPAALAAQEITGAAYVEPTTAYGHGALAGGEYAGLRIGYDDGADKVIRFPGAVFEDTAPRLHDVDGDGRPELVVVVSDFAAGARIVVLGQDGTGLRVLGQTAPIGQRHRWLAIAGIADFDGDGRDEIAYIDRPHLAKTLRLVSVEIIGGTARFTPLAEAAGLTNHHLGAADIEGGLRACPGAAPVVVSADGGWRDVVETRLVGGRLASTPVAPYTGPASLAARLVCP